MEKLAINGGKPVREKAFPTNYLGVSLYDDKELEQVVSVVKDKSPFRHYGIGNPNKTELFEQKVREYFGCKHALAVTSGTAALFCAIIALGIGPGDEVILPTFGWFSNFFAITNAGALPVFADIDETLGLDAEDFERKITPNTKAVIVIDFQGSPANMNAVMRIAKNRGIKVIEDIAQAFGGEYNGTKLGRFGDIAVASFQLNKILCCGEGGIIFTDDDKYFNRAIRYHDLGFLRPYFDKLIDKEAYPDVKDSFAGSQYRMSEFQGAVLLAQIDKLDYILNTCREHHARIRESFKDNLHFKIRYIQGDCGITVFMLFDTSEEAGNFERCLRAEGIPTGAKSACRNLLHEAPITTKELTHPAMPPFGKGYAGENVDYTKSNETMKTDGIISRYVAMSIGPQYTYDDVTDIITAIQKVDENLYK